MCRAAHDDAAKVIIILSGVGPHFSTGHDMGGDRGKTWRDFETVGTWAGFDGKGVEGLYGREKEIYLEMCERRRNIPKPTIAAVQGSCVAGGLMLAWVCNLIMATESARFKDPTLEFGVAGVEYFMHPWELGTRKAKEFLLASEWLGALQWGILIDPRGVAPVVREKIRARFNLPPFDIAEDDAGIAPSDASARGAWRRAAVFNRRRRAAPAC